ncbi:hypothetical protein HY251_20935 [bacterium]|nr:hypothetical protein [bacterium]
MKPDGESKKKLSLEVESLRELTQQEMMAANGGFVDYIFLIVGDSILGSSSPSEKWNTNAGTADCGQTQQAVCPSRTAWCE